MSYKFLFFTFFANGKCTLHDAWHALRLVAVARTADACQPLVPCFAVGRQNLGYPCSIVVADIAEVAGHGEDEIVS